MMREYDVLITAQSLAKIIGEYSLFIEDYRPKSTNSIRVLKMVIFMKMTRHYVKATNSKPAKL